MKKIKYIFIIISVISLIIISIIINKYSMSKEYNNELSRMNSRDIQFVRTYNILEKLECYDETGEYGYVVVKQFQVAEPTIIKIKLNDLEKLEIGKNYEFTFVGQKSKESYDILSYSVPNTFKLIKIEQTTKEGLEQRQESFK